MCAAMDGRLLSGYEMFGVFPRRTADKADLHTDFRKIAACVCVKMIDIAYGSFTCFVVITLFHKGLQYAIFLFFFELYM